jgi:hypothetical protein
MTVRRLSVTRESDPLVGAKSEKVHIMALSQRSGSFALEHLPHTFGILQQDIHTPLCLLACLCNFRGNLCRCYGNFRENLE